MEQDFTKYDVEDFVADEGFAAWVTRKENDQFWSQFMIDHPEKVTAIQQAGDWVKTLSAKTDVMPTAHKKAVWQRIQRSTSAGTSMVRRLYIAASVAAACVAIFYFTGLFQGSSTISIVNAGTENKEQVLPDQSIVVLAPGADLRYQPETYLENRKVELQGKAFFEVEKGSPFSVHTKEGVVEVLGTSFEVNTAEKSFQVVCYTGKVRVSHRQNKVVLTPGEKTAFGISPDHKSSFDLPAGLQPHWLTAYLVFDNATLEEVIKKVENIYGVTIEIEPLLLSGVKHSGNVVKDDIDQALTSITWPHHLSYELEGEVVKIIKKVE